MRVAPIALLILAPLSGFGVSPLVVDDADTVEPGRLQFNGGWQFSRTASIRLHSIPISPVLGLNSRGELGTTFGYQWRDRAGPGPLTANANGITDLTLGDQVASVANR